MSYTPEQVGRPSMPERPMSLLSDVAILRHLKSGNIVIDPFVRQNLGPNSYDVTLGELYYFAHHPQTIAVSLEEHSKSGVLRGLKGIEHSFRLWRQGQGNLFHRYPYGGWIYNPYDQKQVTYTWGEPNSAHFAREIEKNLGFRFNNISPEEKVILLPPRGLILAHTQEFIGGRNKVTTMMKARSSWGRNFVAVCDDAGWGDVGFINRWTLEIRNKQDFYVVLVVGRRIAQMAFFEVEPPISSYEGKYQEGTSLEEIKKKWTPEMMLPKMWKDREVPLIG